MCENEIIKLKYENQEFRIILHNIEQLKNPPTLSQKNIRKYGSVNNILENLNLSKIDVIEEKIPVQVSAKSELYGEKLLFIENMAHKLNESRFNCDSLSMKMINNTDLNNSTNQNENEEEEEEKPVFKTLTGKKYHNANCICLENSRIRIELQEAQKKKMKPCKVCAPPDYF